jgi:hypothetical protein
MLESCRTTEMNEWQVLGSAWLALNGDLRVFVAAVLPGG